MMATCGTLAMPTGSNRHPTHERTPKNCECRVMKKQGGGGERKLILPNSFKIRPPRGISSRREGDLHHDTQPLGSMGSVSREGLKRLGRGWQGSTQERGQAPIWRAKGRGWNRWEGSCSWWQWTFMCKVWSLEDCAPL